MILKSSCRNSGRRRESQISPWIGSLCGAVPELISENLRRAPGEHPQLMEAENSVTSTDRPRRTRHTRRRAALPGSSLKVEV